MGGIPVLVAQRPPSPRRRAIRSTLEDFSVLEANRMRLGRFEFVIDFGSFRRITACWSGPGWDFNFSGACVNDDAEDTMFPDGRIGVYCEAAPLPLAKGVDYTGVEVDLPGSYDEGTGEPYFAVDVGESYEVSDARLRFAGREASRYLIELTGTVSEAVLGKAERFELLAWADELPDHSYSE
jgi:hypothetical protein